MRGENYGTIEGWIYFSMSENLPYFLDGEVDKYPVLLVPPAIPGGQAHAVEQQAVQPLGLREKAPKVRVGHKLAGNADKLKIVRFLAVVIFKFLCFCHSVSFQA